MSEAQAQRYLLTVLDPLCTVYPDIALYQQTLAVRQRWHFSFYDSLIIAAALTAECSILYSEDLQHQQQRHPEHSESILVKGNQQGLHP